MRSRKKDRLANMRGRRWLKHPRGILFSAQIAAQHQAAHAVRHDVHLVDGLAVGVFQTRREKRGEGRREIFNGGGGRQAARAEEQAHLAIALEHLIGDAERAGKRVGQPSN